MCAMWFPESDTIVADHPELAEEIGAVDRYLGEMGPETFRLEPTADLLDMAPGTLARLLRRYEADGLVEAVEVYLCPEDESILEENEDGVLCCDLCEGEYAAEECETEIAYRLRPSVAPPAPPVVPRAPAAARIFLSYAREDRAEVERLYEKLREAGFRPWMDTKDILPGEQWATSIERAIRGAHFFLACLSKRSVTKRGWIQKEIRGGLDLWEEMLENDIYLIPLRLDECDVPERLQAFQWVDLFAADGWPRLVQAIRTGMARRAVGGAAEGAGESPAARVSPPPSASSAPAQPNWRDQDPPLAVVRKLLLAAFTPEALRRFCLDRPAFQPVVAEFGPGHGLHDMVDRLLAYCRTRLLWQELLEAVKEENPRQYAQYEEALGGR